MARPKTNHIDPDEILQAIHRQTFGRQREIDAELKKLKLYSHDDYPRWAELHRERTRAEWAEYRIEALLGRGMSDAERRAYQRAIATLRADGLVEILGQRGSAIRLTPRGRKRVEAEP